jgi:hypothetical protein
MSDSSFTGVVNPYAMAEVIAGRKFDWDQEERPDLILEEILETPYDELFDPQFGSPLYPGLRLREDLTIESVPMSEIKIQRKEEIATVTEAGNITSVDGLVNFLSTHRNERLQLRNSVRTTPRRLSIDLDLGDSVPITLSNVVWPPHLVDLVFDTTEGDKEKNKDKEWDPQELYWMDPGQFFNKAANFFDPVQGSVGNCYFVAALGSVAWTRPYQIAHRTRPIRTHSEATSGSQTSSWVDSGTSPGPRFTCMIEFHQAGNIDHRNAETAEVEVTEQLPLSITNHNFIYCKSSEPGEIWPGVYEKAFAKWITGNKTDKPNIAATGGPTGGSPSRVVRQLTGEHNVTVNMTKDRTAEQLWQFVWSNSVNQKTVHPMVAGTYGTAKEAPDKDVGYTNATIVAWHAYSVLGWASSGSRRFIVLRNPWGKPSSAPDPANGLSGNWMAHHVDFWKPIALGPRGVFAVDAPTFKKYFKDIAVVRR